MMRNGDAYGLAVRRPDGSIRAQRLPWFSLTRRAWLKKTFVRGFPILLETLVNGIQALNRSVEAAAQSGEEELSGWHLALSLGLALLMAIALFVVAPHLLSLVMLWLHLGGDVEGLSFHIWDGFFKCCIFMDADTKARLEQGARIVEVLKQNQNSPVPVEKQVAILYAVTKGNLVKVEVEDVKTYEAGLYTYLDTDAQGVEVMQEIRTTGKLESETESKLKNVLDVYTENFLNTRPEK